MNQAHMNTFSHHTVHYMGTSAQSFRKGERGLVQGMVSVDEGEGDVTIHFHVLYDDGFEYLAPFSSPETYELLGPEDQRVEGMKRTFDRVDSYRPKPIHRNILD